MAADEEIREVEERAATDPSVRAAINNFSISLEKNAIKNAIAPPAVVKPFLMATLDLMERLAKGETLGSPPKMHSNSKIADYEDWLNRPDMALTPYFEGVYAKIIGYTPKIITAIVWLREMAPDEVHHSEYKNFLIVEGTCSITIEEEVHNLVPGDYLAIPLYKNHFVTVTSEEVCKVILQRVAA
ncbi:MAG: cupin domain-containing protein [Chitinophagaceae bacterium]|nr:cupin domain-containing protein [Chitinophagaceae bacterium]